MTFLRKAWKKPGKYFRNSSFYVLNRLQPTLLFFFVVFKTKLTAMRVVGCICSKRCTNNWTGKTVVWHNFFVSHGGLSFHTSKTFKSYVIQKYLFRLQANEIAVFMSTE